jgi:hypothetical protein
MRGSSPTSAAARPTPPASIAAMPNASCSPVTSVKTLASGSIAAQRPAISVTPARAASAARSTRPCAQFVLSADPARHHARIGQKWLRGYQRRPRAAGHALANPVRQHRQIGMAAAHQHKITAAHASNHASPARPRRGPITLPDHPNRWPAARFFAAFLHGCACGSSRGKLKPITGRMPLLPRPPRARLRIPGHQCTRPLEATAIRSHQASFSLCRKCGTLKGQALELSCNFLIISGTRQGLTRPGSGMGQVFALPHGTAQLARIERGKRSCRLRSQPMAKAYPFQNSSVFSSKS